MNWFDIDKKGLAELLELRGKEFILYELLQNAWDEDSTEVRVTLEKLPGRPAASITVEDNSPEGFKDLSHAWTMFAHSTKRDDPEKRGRFTFGEKLVLACCSEARITTTTGTVIFDAKGRRQTSTTRKSGSVFEGTFRCNQREFEAIIAAARRVIPPKNIATKVTVVGDPDAFYDLHLKRPRFLASVGLSLLTIIEEPDGRLVERVRSTTVDVLRPGTHGTYAGPGYIYEMGIPIVETGDTFHYDVQQKVPLNMDRDNVRPPYLAKVRAHVLNARVDLLDEEEAAAPWVNAAIGHHDALPEVVGQVVQKRFGKNVVTVDPSDREAEHRAKANGYTVLHGGTFTKKQWEKVRQSDVAPSAGQKFPTPKPFTPGGDPLKMVPQEKWTRQMHEVVALASAIAQELLDTDIDIQVTADVKWPFAAAYGSRSLILNKRRLGKRWFDEWATDAGLARVLDLLVHEFGHHYCANHLDAKYHDALTRLAGKTAVLALTHPEIFGR